VPASIAKFDIWVMTGATTLLLLMAVRRWRINRVEGGVLLGAYVAYSVWLGLMAGS
jgi:cation:H+ antiporter